MCKDLSSLKSVELIFLSVQELNLSTLNDGWKNVWSEIVSQENLLNSTSINFEPVVNIARSVGREGFDKMDERDTYELINDSEDLDGEDPAQLANTSDASTINNGEESSTQIIDEVNENLCIEKT